MPKRQPPRITACDTRTQDYPSTMSLYEKESLAAEAKLKIEKEKNRLERMFRLEDPRN
ncbi:MAG: hypothetical protein WCC95_20050 [Candidatus Sulfotelmatobacter sp.]|jgi:hypothetical protein